MQLLFSSSLCTRNTVLLVHNSCLHRSRMRCFFPTYRLSFFLSFCYSVSRISIKSCGNCSVRLVSNRWTCECTAGSDVLRELYSELTTLLDARIVAANMYQRKALTIKELQSIQSLRDRPVEAAEKLLNIIMEQPDAVYLCFFDILKHTGQQHIYKKMIEARYKSE